MLCRLVQRTVLGQYAQLDYLRKNISGKLKTGLTLFLIITRLFHLSGLKRDEE